MRGSAQWLSLLRRVGKRQTTELWQDVGLNMGRRKYLLPLCRFSCGFTFGVLKSVSELIQFLVRHAKSQSRFTPSGEGELNPAQSFARPGP